MKGEPANSHRSPRSTTTEKHRDGQRRINFCWAVTKSRRDDGEADERKGGPGDCERMKVSVRRRLRSRRSRYRVGGQHERDGYRRGNQAEAETGSEGLARCIFVQERPRNTP
ncbi:hypothetical protein CLAIMM_13328 isoform 2 [Cladophialophora immunda]|nr:hypothetical protein CLAIMM_13328 isoform 1 [Cladophialophora immunda]OQV09170.1 hypothetical protein CLAIMM_13328 isoform 2 [Cladophialophora immunda]